MFGDSMRMKCGHLSDCVMTDVPHGSERVDLAACSVCFDHIASAIQPACVIDTTTPRENFEPLPSIKRNYGLPLAGAIVCLVTIITLIVSL